MRKVLTSLLFFVALLGTASAQTQINPATQIRWPVITGTVDPVAPTWPCTATQYGMPYTNVTSGNTFHCTSIGWVNDDISFVINSFASSSCITVELGSTITNPAFTASYSTIPASASITNTDGISSPTNLTTPFTGGTVTGGFSHNSATNVVFTLTATGSSVQTRTCTASWQPRTFYGVGTGSGATGATASGNNAVLVGATGTLGTFGLGMNTGTVSVSPSTQFIYFLLSTSGHTFKINGFTTTFSCSAISYTNQNSVVINPMQLCVSPASLSGTYSVEVD